MLRASGPVMNRVLGWCAGPSAARCVWWSGNEVWFGMAGKAGRS